MIRNKKSGKIKCTCQLYSSQFLHSTFNSFRLALCIKCNVHSSWSTIHRLKIGYYYSIAGTMVWHSACQMLVIQQKKIRKMKFEISYYMVSFGLYVILMCIHVCNYLSFYLTIMLLDKSLNWTRNAPFRFHSSIPSIYSIRW